MNFEKGKGDNILKITPIQMNDVLSKFMNSSFLITLLTNKMIYFRKKLVISTI